MRSTIPNCCAECKYFNKCRKISTIHGTLLDFMQDVFEQYFIDIEIVYRIKDCVRFTPDFNEDEQGE